MKQQRLQSNTSFNLMAYEYRIRDWLHPPGKILEQEGLRPGMTVLDYGCGPGGFSIAAARIVGSTGRVYAVDVHPLAICSVQRAVKTKCLDNVQLVFADKIAEIEEGSVDLALLHNVLHDVIEPKLVLRELYRLLAPRGVLCVRDHRLNERSLMAAIMSGGFFRFFERTRGTYKFKKIPEGELHL